MHLQNGIAFSVTTKKTPLRTEMLKILTLNTVWTQVQAAYILSNCLVLSWLLVMIY